MNGEGVVKVNSSVSVIQTKKIHFFDLEIDLRKFGVAHGPRATIPIGYLYFYASGSNEWQEAIIFDSHIAAIAFPQCKQDIHNYHVDYSYTFVTPPPTNGPNFLKVLSLGSLCNVFSKVYPNFIEKDAKVLIYQDIRQHIQPSSFPNDANVIYNNLFVLPHPQLDRSTCMLPPENPDLEVFQLPKSHVAYSGPKTYGLRVTSNIDKGTLLGFYAGILTMNFKMAFQMITDIKPHSLYFESPSKYHSFFLDATKMGNTIRFINDVTNTGKEPNVEFLEVESKNNRIGLPPTGAIGCVAIRPIKAGEELLAAYPKSYWENLKIPYSEGDLVNVYFAEDDSTIQARFEYTNFKSVPGQVVVSQRGKFYNVSMCQLRKPQAEQWLPIQLAFQTPVTWRNLYAEVVETLSPGDSYSIVVRNLDGTVEYIPEVSYDELSNRKKQKT